MSPPAPRRGRPPRLTRGAIVDAAVALIDRDGVDGLTMRALARELRVDPMAVYRHVRDKDELLGAVCDAVIAELAPLDPTGPWEPQVRALAHDLRAALVRRPGLIPVLVAAPVTPAGLAIAQQGVELLVGAGAPPSLAAGAFTAIFAYVLGFAAFDGVVPPAPANEAALRRGALEHLGRDPGDPPPHLDAAMAVMSDAGDFELGLDLLLDGLRRRISRA